MTCTRRSPAPRRTSCRTAAWPSPGSTGSPAACSRRGGRTRTWRRGGGPRTRTWRTGAAAAAAPTATRRPTGSRGAPRPRPTTAAAGPVPWATPGPWRSSRGGVPVPRPPCRPPHVTGGGGLRGVAVVHRMPESESPRFEPLISGSARVSEA